MSEWANEKEIEIRYRQPHKITHPADFSHESIAYLVDVAKLVAAVEAPECAGPDDGSHRDLAEISPRSRDLAEISPGYIAEISPRCAQRDG